MYMYMYIIRPLRVSSPPNQQGENKTVQLFLTSTHSVNSYTLSIDNTRHTHILQLYVCLKLHILSRALCTGLLAMNMMLSVLCVIYVCTYTLISCCHVVPRCNKCDIAPFTYISPPLGMHLVGFMLSCIFNVSDYNTM